MEEKEYCELFGIDPEGGQEQELAEPAIDHSQNSTGEQEQEAAEPAAQEDRHSEETREEPEGEEARDEQGKSTKAGNEQTPQERARFAAIRRKAEAQRDAAIQKAQEDAQKTIEQVFVSSGLVNPYTKQPIKSKADFDAYKAQLDADKKARILKRTGMSEEEFSQYVETMPQVQQMRERAAAAEEAERRAQQEQAKAKIAEQIKVISEMDPSITKLEDLPGMENYQQFYELVKKGNSLADAFKLVNYEKLTRKIAEAAVQADRNAAAGKAHLSRTTQRGSGSASVPPEIRAEYKAMMPGATDAEIAAHYNRYIKGK